MLLVYESIRESECHLNHIICGINASHQKCVNELGKVLQDKPNWSQLALDNYDSNGKLLTQLAAEVVEYYKKAAIGIAVANQFPLPSPLNSETAKEYIAELWGLKTADIDIMVAMTE